MQFVALPESAIASRTVGLLLGSEPLLNEIVLMLLLIKLHHNKEFNMQYSYWDLNKLIESPWNAGWKLHYDGD